MLKQNKFYMFFFSVFCYLNASEEERARNQYSQELLFSFYTKYKTMIFHKNTSDKGACETLKPITKQV